MNVTKNRYGSSIKTLCTRACAFVFILALTACSGLLFYPDQRQFHTPEELDLIYEDRSIITEDSEKLHAWWFPANSPQPAKGSILFLHGNAENISTHFANIAWLPAAGYNVLALDYRGYGMSTGTPDLSGALIDIRAAYSALMNENGSKNLPLFILGQSIGAALSVTFLGHDTLAQANTTGLIVDSGFGSFRGITREKLAQVWLTWPLQYPLSYLIPDTYDAEKVVGEISPIPILYFHSRVDQIIPFHHGKHLFELSHQPKYLVETNQAHIDTFTDVQNRYRLLSFLKQSSHARLTESVTNR